MSTDNTSVCPSWGFGYNPLHAAGVMTPVNGAAPTTVNAFGLTFARTGEGIWTATLKEIPKGGFTAIVQGVFASGGREMRMTACVQATGVITFTNDTNAGGAADDVTGLTAVMVLVYGVRG